MSDVGAGGARLGGTGGRRGEAEGGGDTSELTGGCVGRVGDSQSGFVTKGVHAGRPRVAYLEEECGCGCG